MEEADGIIIENLRKIGCDIEDDVTSLAHFTTEMVIEGVVRCISSIQPDVQLNHRMPPNLPARYKLCMDIAKACKDIGYKGDLGYETFLHGSQAEIRRVFIILIQKLPKVNEQPITESVDSLQQNLKHIRSEILNQLHKPWVPYFCRGHEHKYFSFSSCDISQKDCSMSSQLSSIPSFKLVPSLLENQSSELAAEKYGYKIPAKRINKKNCNDENTFRVSSRFALNRILLHSDCIEKKKSKPQLPPKPAHLLAGNKVAENQPTKEEQCQKLSVLLENLEHEVKQRNVELTGINEAITQMKQSIEQKETELDVEQKEMVRQEKLFSLLPDAPSHLIRMEKLLESSHQKMELLEQQWLEIKQPLEDEYQHWLRKKQKSLAEHLKCGLEQTIQSLRQVVGEIHTKEDVILSLQSRLEALPSSALTRTFYTQRILSIVANVKKQNEEMYRVLEDVKSVQREINTLQGKVERTFTFTDEMIFRLAKSDESARRIYKYLISLHSDCNEILQLVKESGTLSREIKDLEEHVETEMRKNIGSKLKQMRSDLEQIRLENRTLEHRIRNGAK